MFPPSSTPLLFSSLDKAPLHTFGSSQFGIREFNERVILQAIRLHGSLPKADLARLTNLSAQTVSVIINRLLDEGLVTKLDSLRGKIGQPSQPIGLHPDGAFSIGIGIGRRQLEVVLIDFMGHPRFRSTTSYAMPCVDMVFGEIGAQLVRICDFLGPELACRLSGIGLAAPLTFGGWQQLLGMSAKEADIWTRTPMRERLQTMTTLPVSFAKDTAAACVAELVAGQGRSVKSYLYIFLDTLIGGGMVINSQPYRGLYGNAGAMGSMALGMAPGKLKQPSQLLDSASMIRLEALFAEAGIENMPCNDERVLQGRWLKVTQRWIYEAADSIAFAINSSACLLDLDGVIIDGAIHRALLQRLLEAIRGALQKYSWQGVICPEVLAGVIGADAKVIGAAHLSLHANFAPAHDLFLKMNRH